MSSFIAFITREDAKGICQSMENKFFQGIRQHANAESYKKLYMNKRGGLNEFAH